MDVSNLYVPNAAKWIQYYKDNINLHTSNGMKRNQRGGSFVGGAKTVISPIEYKKHAPSQMEITEVPVKIVSPSQAAVDQAKTEIDSKAHVKRGLKRKRKVKYHRKGAKRRHIKTKSKVRKTHKRLNKKKKNRKDSSDIFN